MNAIGSEEKTSISHCKVYRDEFETFSNFYVFTCVFWYTIWTGDFAFIIIYSEQAAFVESKHGTNASHTLNCLLIVDRVPLALM